MEMFQSQQPAPAAATEQPQGEQPVKTICIDCMADGTFVVYDKTGASERQPAATWEEAMTMASAMLDGAAVESDQAAEDAAAEEMFGAGFKGVRGA
jgi:hypothetical protein